MAARPASARPETGRPAFELEPARACGSRGSAADPVCRPNCPGAQSELARRARSRRRAQSERVDGQGAISRLGDIVRPLLVGVGFRCRSERGHTAKALFKSDSQASPPSSLENAQAMAAHKSPRTTKLYDRTGDEITLDEAERITI